MIPDSGPAEPAYYLYIHYNNNGSLAQGYDPDGLNRHTGDPVMNDLTTKAIAEPDAAKRKDLVFQIEKREAQELWNVRFAGGATQLDLAWPAYRGRQVWQGTTSRGVSTNWLDRNKPPFKV